MNEFLQFALLGLGFGALYALAAQGVVLIYRGSGVINFAQGAMGMMGAFVYYTLHYHPVEPGGIIPTQRWGFWPSLIGGVLVSALLGLLTYVFVMRPLRRGIAAGPVGGHPRCAHDPVRARRHRPQDR